MRPQSTTQRQSARHRKCPPAIDISASAIVMRMICVSVAECDDFHSRFIRDSSETHPRLVRDSSEIHSTFFRRHASPLVRRTWRDTSSVSRSLSDGKYAARKQTCGRHASFICEFICELHMTRPLCTMSLRLVCGSHSYLAVSVALLVSELHNVHAREARGRYAICVHTHT